MSQTTKPKPKPKKSKPESEWPKIGIAMPTVDNAEQACEAMGEFSATYPGEIVFAVVANGTSPLHLATLRAFAKKHAGKVILEELKENKGYGIGCNVGLGVLENNGGFGYYGVINDDVFPAATCLTEMVSAFKELETLGHHPGLIAPVSNNINGAQQREIGEYKNLAELKDLAERWYAEHHESVTQTAQLRGLFLLIHPECLKAIGGFDPRYGIGNFEDDDFNLRARLSGFKLWIADGAFLHHYGSTTFKKLGIDYRANMERNAEAFLRKWNLERLEDWPWTISVPPETSLYCPLGLPEESSTTIRINGESVDLVEQASDVEFAAWVMSAMSNRPRKDRETVIECVRALAA